MTIRLVGREARELLERNLEAESDPASDGEFPLWERPRALKVLSRECDSFTRLGSGVVAWAAGVGGGAGLLALLWSGAALWVHLLGAVAAIVLLPTAAWLGHTTWRAGRQVVDAFCWWTRLPERSPDGGAGFTDWRASPVSDAVQARVFMFQGWRPLRLVLAVAAVMSPLAFIQLALTDSPRFQPTWQDGQTPAVTVFVIVLAVTGVIAGVGTFGGQVRANRAQAERDPVQRRLLGRDQD